MRWIRKHIAPLHSLAVLAMVAQLGVAMACCMGTTSPMAAAMKMDMHMLGAMEASLNQEAPAHHHEGESDCECLDACMGMAPALPMASIALPTPMPLAQMGHAFGNDQRPNTAAYRAASARAPPVRA